MKQLGTLLAWTEGRKLARVAHELTASNPLRRDLPLVDQIRRSARSIPANIVEGYCLATRPQWIRHLRIALASAAELRAHLEHAIDVGLLPEPAGSSAIAKTDREIGLIVGLLKKLGAKAPT